MASRISAPTLALAAAMLLAGCLEHARVPISEGYGVRPTLPPPDPGLVPTVHIAPAVGWAPGATPVAAPGLAVQRFADGLEHPRWLYVLPNGDVLVAESNAPPRPLERRGLRAKLMEVDPATSRYRVCLWTVVNERDEIGSDLVPDYLTSVRDGGFYGWPYSYYGGHVDVRATPPRPDLVARAIVPDYALGPHTASLGLVFYDGTLLPARYRHGAFIGQHGSWNRRPPSGYKVIFVPFADGLPSGPPQDVLTGFLDDAGNARGRPVGVAVAADGAVLVADDVGNAVWRIAPAPPRPNR